jgi:repressor LexA
MLEPLSPKQAEAFHHICEAHRNEGRCPSIRELMHALGLSSTASVVRRIEPLARKGWIVRRPGESRGIAISEEAAARQRGMPWSGVIAAGALHEAIEQQERIDFAELLHQGGHFTLSVRGDSMIDAHILDGDLVVVRGQRTAARGQIAVIRTPDGQATVKYWFPEAGRIRLQPANRRLKPIYVREAEVVGVVVSVVRRLEG